jgi:hypothetical protein
VAASKRPSAIEDARTFCDKMELENRVRNAIAAITAKLIRSNLSAEEGERRAKSLVKAYGLLKRVEEELEEELE